MFKLSHSLVLGLKVLNVLAFINSLVLNKHSKNSIRMFVIYMLFYFLVQHNA